MVKKVKQKILAVLFCIVLLSFVSVRWTEAQSVDTRWSPVVRLSSETGQASQGYMASDQYGYVHVFWSESGFPDGRPILMYSRFDGETWSPPVDIFVSFPETVISFVSPFVDSQGTLHLLWSEGTAGPVFYSHAPAYAANSATAWRSKIIVDIPAFWGRLRVDSKGVIHVFYSDYYGDLAGVYYLRSMDQGLTWSSPYWVDPDIPPEYAPTIVEFDMDETDGLHALWYYVDRGGSGGNIHWIRYTRSMDGGETWDVPFTIDEADESPDELRAAYPEFIVSGKTVHVIWAGTNRTLREYRFSRDAGERWSNTNQIMDDLQGQALGGGLAADADGRIHYVTQVRYPQGIYHTSRDNSSWSIPTLFYLIAQSSNDSIGDRIHAHYVRLAIRAGNQLVTTFTGSPFDPRLILYSMHQTLPDVSPLPVLPTPAVELALTPEVETTIEVEAPTPAAIGNPLADLPPAEVDLATGSRSIIWGLVPSLILIAGAIIFYRLRKR
jgi:hypothetical protein